MMAGIKVYGNDLAIDPSDVRAIARSDPGSATVLLSDGERLEIRQHAADALLKDVARYSSDAASKQLP